MPSCKNTRNIRSGTRDPRVKPILDLDDTYWRLLLMLMHCRCVRRGISQSVGQHWVLQMIRRCAMATHATKLSQLDIVSISHTFETRISGLHACSGIPWRFWQRWVMHPVTCCAASARCSMSAIQSSRRDRQSYCYTLKYEAFDPALISLRNLSDGSARAGATASSKLVDHKSAEFID